MTRAFTLAPFLAYVLLLLPVSPVQAQEAAPDTTIKGCSPTEDTRLQVRLRSRSESPPGAPTLPLSAIRRLVAEEHMHEFSVETNRAQTEFSVELLFDDADAFRTWYDSESAQKLIEALHRRDDVTRLSMQVRRF